MYNNKQGENAINTIIIKHRSNKRRLIAQACHCGVSAYGILALLYKLNPLVIFGLQLRILIFQLVMLLKQIAMV